MYKEVQLHAIPANRLLFFCKFIWLLNQIHSLPVQSGFILPEGLIDLIKCWLSMIASFVNGG